MKKIRLYAFNLLWTVYLSDVKCDSKIKAFRFVSFWVTVFRDVSDCLLRHHQIMGHYHDYKIIFAVHGVEINKGGA